MKVIIWKCIWEIRTDNPKREKRTQDSYLSRIFLGSLVPVVSKIIVGHAYELLGQVYPPGVHHHLSKRTGWHLPIEDPVLAKKPDPGLCTSNEGRFLKVFKANIPDNFKSHLFWFHTFVLESENQPGTGSIKIRTGSVARAWSEKPARPDIWPMVLSFCKLVQISFSASQTPQIVVMPEIRRVFMSVQAVIAASFEFCKSRPAMIYRSLTLASVVCP